MNVQSTNSNYQSYVATCTAQTGSRQLAAQVSQSLSELTVALPMRVENMVGFNKKGPPKKLFFSFVTTVLCYIHYVNHAAPSFNYQDFNSAIICGAITYLLLLL